MTVCVCFYCDTPLTWDQDRITAWGKTTCGCVNLDERIGA